MSPTKTETDKKQLKQKSPKRSEKPEPDGRAHILEELKHALSGVLGIFAMVMWGVYVGIVFGVTAIVLSAAEFSWSLTFVIR